MVVRGGARRRDERPVSARATPFLLALAHCASRRPQRALAAVLVSSAEPRRGALGRERGDRPSRTSLEPPWVLVEGERRTWNRTRALVGVLKRRASESRVGRGERRRLVLGEVARPSEGAACGAPARAGWPWRVAWTSEWHSASEWTNWINLERDELRGPCRPSPTSSSCSWAWSARPEC